MPDRLEFDLEAVAAILDHPLDLRPYGVLRCVPEVSISPGDRAAILASYGRGIANVILPLNRCSASLASERN